MKLIVLLVVALFGVAYCAPQSDSDHPTDEIVFEQIDSVIKDITKPLSSKFRRRDYFEGYVLKAIQHINKECILTSYKKHHFVDRIPTEAYLKTADERTKALSQFAFIATLASCYRKGDVILEYLFENLMTHNILVRAFIDEPAFKDYAEFFNCASKYGVDKHIWNPSEYGFTPKAIKSPENCTEWTSEGEELWLMVVEKFYEVIAEDYNKDCYKTFATSFKNFAFKYVLLIQVHFTDAKRVESRAQFVKDTFALSDQFVTCIAIPAPAVNEIH